MRDRRLYQRCDALDCAGGGVRDCLVPPPPPPPLFYYKAIDRIGAAKAMALNISYSGWAIPLSAILIASMPTATGVVCAVAIIVGAIVAATDVKELVAKRA